MRIQETVFDEKLPQMEALMNSNHMGEVFERALKDVCGKAAGCRIESCRIVYTKYRPGKNLLFAYLLKVADTESGHSREQMLAMLSCAKGESGDLFAIAKNSPLVETGFGDGVFHIPAMEAVVWVFPNDRKLTGLPALVDPEGLRERFLPEIVGGSFDNEWSIIELESIPVHYVPERACTLRVKLGLRNERTGETETRLLFGKTYCSGEGEAAWQRLQTLWDSETRKAGRLLIAQPLQYHPEIRTLWQGGLVGKTLNEVEANSRLFFESLANAGSAVAELHRTPVPSAPSVTTGEIVSKLEASAALLCRLRPNLRDELRSSVEQLIAVSDRIGIGPIATLHGDLHLKNLFVTNDRVALIDLDNLSRGDPARDVGSFVASLHYRGLIDGRGYQFAEDRSSRFIQSYRANADWEVSEWALNWHIAAALIYERAYRCVTRLKVGRLDILDEIIALSRIYRLRI